MAKSKDALFTESMQKALWLSGALAVLGAMLLALAIVGLTAY